MEICEAPPTPAREERWTIFLLLLAGSGAVFFALFSNRVFAIGPFSHHMVVHIALMNAAAPALALAYEIRFGWRRPRIDFRALAFFAFLQLFLFFGWHSPSMAAGVAESALVSSTMQTSLFAAAFLFWLAVFRQRGHACWRSILALLITGKLFCLMAAVLVFSPRVLYGVGPTAHAGAVSLADQQLAGLIMVVVCPLAYVASAVFLTVRWLNQLSRPRRKPEEPTAGARA